MDQDHFNDRNFKHRTTCPSCGSKNFQILVDTSFSDPALGRYLNVYYSSQGNPDFNKLAGETYCLGECHDCQLMFQVNIPTNPMLMEIYDQWVSQKNSFEASSKSSLSRQFRAVRKINAIVRHLGKATQDVKALDFGMGWGDWLFAARGLGCKVYGLELSPARIEWGEANGITILTAETMRQNKYDVICCNQVLEHVSEPREVLELIRECLAPRGIVLLSVPNALPVRKRISAGLGVDWAGEPHSREKSNPTEAVTPLEHLNCFTGKTLRSFAKACGFSEVHFSPRIQLLTTCLDADSVKDLIKNSLIRFGVVDSFTDVVLTHSSL
jgi:2-polyprenyl-3-methyl-5-hydroxy-6-metoxy-1,4-benzoquinol methylase